MIRPREGQVLVRVLPNTQSSGGIEFPVRRISPEEQQQLNHNPQPPPPDLCQVEAIGPWKKLGNGMSVPPPFPPGARVLVREGSGQKLSHDVNERFKLVKVEDVLAVIVEA